MLNPHCASFFELGEAVASLYRVSSTKGVIVVGDDSQDACAPNADGFHKNAAKTKKAAFAALGASR